MSSSLRHAKRYPDYRHSGVEWLGDVPEHWTVRRLKFVAPSVDHRSDDRELPYIGLENVESQTGRLLAGSSVLTAEAEPEAETAASLFEPGDVLFGKLRPYLAKVVAAPFRGRCSTELMVLRSRGEISSALLAYQLRSEGFIAWVNALTYGTKMPRASPDHVLNVTIPLPRPEEQRAIAAFLDRETARVDALVAKKERLIELLEERRVAYISRLVTKGLNPGVSCMETGVDWLGAVPSSWKVAHLRYAITFQRGHDLPSDTREDGIVPVVSSAGISSAHSVAAAKAPGIVTGRYGTIGEFHLVLNDYWPLNTTLYSIDLHGNDPRFLRFMLKHLSPLFLLNAVKSAVPGVDRNDIHPILAAVPPLVEQRAIADALVAEDERVDKVLFKLRRAIDHLTERRTALIAAAVTGKIDVREEVA